MEPRRKARSPSWGMRGTGAGGATSGAPHPRVRGLSPAARACCRLPQRAAILSG